MIHIRLVESLLQLLWCPHGTYLAIHHNTDAVAIFCFVHVVGGDEDGYATWGGIVYELPELSACGGIHTASRLVKKHYLRFVEDGYREGELLLPA